MPTVAPLDLDGHVVAAAFLADVPFFASASGAIHRLDHGQKVTEAHDGLLACVRDEANDTLITGGEDGKVQRISADGSVTLLAEVPRKWISVVAAGPQGAVGFAEGRTARVRLADGTIKEFTENRSVEGIAFAPKGLRIGAARYNGASLHWVAMAAQPVDLEWKGAHTGITFSPDGRFVVTSMQDNALHGWKLDPKAGADTRHMRMTGYPAKVKSLSWSAKGKWLASSGAPAAIVWPFSAKDGPMGKPPLELGTRADVMVIAARFTDSREVLLRRPGKGAITTMAWSKNGKLLAFASEAGDCGVIDLAG